ncbi:hypothetical protein J2Z66_008388 [Paenibacillus eucommiae]|uniref:NodB homology domain-containing protein n=1 Tax=Paenibacillus eucommiae TaxID=1355755 RepID=A0ABS4JA69_9BACL|nr:hypothetical protein [Paenibacillus eucommiae]
MKKFTKDVKRAVREGHYVGGHSMTHQYKKLYEEGQLSRSIRKKVTGLAFIRMPHIFT